MVKNPPAIAGDAKDVGSIPGLGRCPGGGNGNSLQYSCLENPMDKGAGWTTVHSIAKNQTQQHTHTHGTLRPDSELPGSKSERGMMTNDKASPHLSIRSSVGRNIFPALHCQSNFAFRALRKRVRKQKFNVNLRANAVVKFQSQSKKVKQMGTCLVPTAAAWLVHRAYCEKNSRPHGGQAEKRADD